MKQLREMFEKSSFLGWPLFWPARAPCSIFYPVVFINLINPDYNVSSTEVMVVLRDQDFLSDTAYFDLAVNQVDDPSVFQSIGVGDNQGEPLKFIEDTGALDFVSEIKIYYYDDDLMTSTSTCLITTITTLRRRCCVV